MEFSPSPPPPSPLFPLERHGRRNSTGMPLDQHPHQQQQVWGFEGLSGGSGSYGSEKNGQSEEHEENESGHSNLCARGHWRPAEDSKLRELVSQYGPQNWNLIAENLEGRSGKSCRLRWFNQLDPRINKKAFTEEEEERLLSAHGLYGNKWALIARYFPGRTDNAVKNHWHVIIARKQREQTNAHRRRKPSNCITTPAPMAFDESAHIAESTISRNRAEPMSTSTDLSLNSSAYIGFTGHGFLTGYNPREPPQPFEYLSGPDEKLVNGRNGCSQILFCSENDFPPSFPHGLVPGFDRSAFFDSNSEASAFEAEVKNNGGDAIIIEDADNEKEKISLPFIDFLGVGAT